MGESMIHNIICLVIGYFCGCISSGYFVGKFHHIDIREHGSGNAGTTNVLRVLGKLPALITFVGDLAKAVMPILVIRIFLSPDNWYLLCLYIGLGVVLGHNYPFYLGFRGGKGIAATAGLVLSVNWIMAICGIITFFTTFFVTHYVSLGSLLVYVGIVIEVIVLGQNGFFHMTQLHLYELYAVAIFLAVLAFWKHRENIKRLLSGTERKTYLSSKNKKK